MNVIFGAWLAAVLLTALGGMVYGVSTGSAEDQR
jgi:hypothetical protein